MDIKIQGVYFSSLLGEGPFVNLSMCLHVDVLSGVAVL